MHNLDEAHDHPEFAAPGPDAVMEDVEGLEMFTLKSVGIDIGSSTTPRLLREFLVSVCPGESSHISLSCLPRPGAQAALCHG
ncbi:MAG TPA: hypothetical protein VIH59_24960 [Candidatus Tectomicrobia bacterium]|jgi:hypothetical protein